MEAALTLYKSPLVNQYPSVFNDLYYRKPQLGPKFSQGFLFPPKTSKPRSSQRQRMRVSAALGGLLGGIFKGTDTGESTKQQYASIVTAVNRFEAEVSALSDSELRDKTSFFKQRAQQGESLDSLLPVSFISSILFFFSM